MELYGYCEKITGNVEVPWTEQHQEPLVECLKNESVMGLDIAHFAHYRADHIAFDFILLYLRNPSFTTKLISIEWAIGLFLISIYGTMFLL